VSYRKLIVRRLALVFIAFAVIAFNIVVCIVAIFHLPKQSAMLLYSLKHEVYFPVLTVHLTVEFDKEKVHDYSYYANWRYILYRRRRKLGKQYTAYAC